MISVEEAKAIVQNTIEPTSSFERIPLSEANTFVLSKDIISEIDMPPFRQSAMDGYALCLHDAFRYQLIGEVKAGDHAHPILQQGEAIRIFTGAPVPDTANAVIMQECVTAKGQTIEIDKAVLVNANIRPLGEQVKKGNIALNKGTLLTSAAIGFLSSLGITEVEVYKKPSVAILVTGNELAKAGAPLQYGQIYESNAIMLDAALNKAGFQNVSQYKVKDDFEETKQIINELISKHDLILISGGISVGDYDFVGKAFASIGVEKLFYKVKQKPGKPLFFGRKENTILFALPGNPAAVLTCFYMYVQETLQKLSGNTAFSVNKIRAKSLSAFTKKEGRAQFLKANYNNNTVEILEGQNSSMLHTFALANALVCLSEENNTININDEVEVILLPMS